MCAVLCRIKYGVSMKVDARWDANVDIACRILSAKPLVLLRFAIDIVAIVVVAICVLCHASPPNGAVIMHSRKQTHKQRSKLAAPCAIPISFLPVSSLAHTPLSRLQFFFILDYHSQRLNVHDLYLLGAVNWNGAAIVSVFVCIESGGRDNRARPSRRKKINKDNDHQ